MQHHVPHPSQLSSPGDSGKALDEGECAFVLLFQSLLGTGRGFSFPCDQHGRVDLDGISDRARNNYLYARAMIGRELALPTVHPADQGERN